MRPIYFVLGTLSFSLGLFGMVIPGLPTTIFVILAAGFFSKSFPKFDNYLLNHPKWGPSIKDWRFEKAISSRGKKAASIGMAIGFVIMLFTVKNLFGLVGGSLGIILSAVYVLTRPLPSRELEAPNKEKNQQLEL